MTEYNPVRKRRRRRRLVLLLLALIAIWLGVSQPWQPTVREGSYLLLELQGDLREHPAEGFFGWLVPDHSPALIELVTLVRAAAEDERIAGMVVRVRSLEIGWAKAQEIRDTLAEFRKTGKPLIAYLEQELSGSTLEYYVASAATKIYLPPAASAPLTGLLAQYVFLGGLWDKLDVQMEVEKIGRYKSVGDMLERESMSPAEREMDDSLLDSIFAQLVSGIAESRGLAPEAVRAAIDRAPATATELTELELADGSRFLADLRRELLGAKRSFLPAADYRKVADTPLRRRGGHTIAIVYGVGPVNTGASDGSGVVDGETMGSDTLARAFRDAVEDPATEALVFRIDSPGGSALASDLIWKAAHDAAAKKPVIVSMSDVAASGGYYVAVGATKILAQPGTLTGSIGVVVAKPNVSGLLGRLGINTETLSRSRYARLSSLTESLGPSGRARVVAAMDYAYGVFVDRVAQGRRLTPERVDELGQGRVWTGAQARENGLVDEIGGLTAAVAAAKSAAGIPEGEEVAFVVYPRPKGIVERLGSAFGAGLAARAPRWWRHLRAATTAYDFPAGSVLTLMPWAVDIR